MKRRSQSASRRIESEAERAGPALFEGLAESDVRAILDKSTRTDFPSRSWLYRQGETSQRFCLVESGLVRLSQITPEGDDVLVRLVKPGEVFGYFAIALGGPNIVSAQAIQPSRLAVWETAIMLHLMHCFPGLAENLFNIVARDVAYFYDRIRRLQTQGVGRRVVWALAELARIIGKATPVGIVISHGLAQRTLSELAGTTIYTVSRELTKLQQVGILQKKRGRIVVLHPDKLIDS
ncbi:MAG TPA: Crp/Fnr family transcriptional regulator [Terriglobales bacterium]|nr:Crp/Fnr family transcriptional regulator [Terriglobales bacterium]